MMGLIIGIFIGVVLGFLIIALFSGGARADLESEIIRKNKRIEDQTKTIFQFRAEAVKYKGMAASEETRADLLQKMKDELQSDYDQLASDYKEVVLDYKKLYLELDAIKNDFNEVIKELSTIEEMLLEVKPKVLLAG